MHQLKQEPGGVQQGRKRCDEPAGCQPSQHLCSQVGKMRQVELSSYRAESDSSQLEPRV